MLITGGVIHSHYLLGTGLKLAKYCLNRPGWPSGPVPTTHPTSQRSLLSSSPLLTERGDPYARHSPVIVVAPEHSSMHLHSVHTANMDVNQQVVISDKLSFTASETH